MATSYKTPGVYINEVSTLPASVAQVPTAIPAFVGYTEFAKELDGSSLTDVPKRISSLVEYVQFFGGSAKPTDALGSDDLPKVTLDETNGYAITDIEIALKYVLYQSLSLYFANGGGACYIVSVGDYDYNRADADVVTDITRGLLALESEDEPTLLLAPDAALMYETAIPLNNKFVKLGNLQKTMLIQCNKMQDRFAIMDLIEDSGVIGEANFRSNVGMQYLKYGAAYGPHLETSLSYNVQFSDLNIVDSLDVFPAASFNTAAVDAIVDAKNDLNLIEAQIGANYLNQFDGIAIVSATAKANLTSKVGKLKLMAAGARALVNTITNIDIRKKVIELVDANSNLKSIIRQAMAYDLDYPGGALPVFLPADFNGSEFPSPPFGLLAADFNFNLGTVVLDPGDIYIGANAEAKAKNAAIYFRALLVEALTILDDLKAEAKRILTLLEESLVSVDPIYASIKRAIAAKGIIVPPSGAVAGAYVATDANRGVWKAPANASLNSVVRPTIKVDNAAQDGLNVDVTAGKSINVIRSFTGKGVLIWGARTLAGNDNEWRYVPVRRLFITVEESIKKATEFVVFEPNDSNTWLRTRTMIQNYLTGLWRQGALAGAKPEDAFFVNVGLGTTMTAQDILEGKMIIEIGLAAVRPAEFIILRFSHKLQES